MGRPAKTKITGKHDNTTPTIIKLTGKHDNNTPTITELTGKYDNTTPTVLHKPLKTKTDENEYELPAVSPEIQSNVVSVCDEVGATMKHCITTLYEGTEANKMTVDKYGEEHVEPDHDKRIKSALGLLELRGDFRSKNGAIDNSKHTHVTYVWKKTLNVDGNQLAEI